MNRRRFLGGICSGALPFLAGCINDPGVNGGMLELLPETAPPEATVVDASDERVQHLGPLQDGLRRIEREEKVAEVRVSEDEYDTVAQTLSELPWYDRMDHDGYHISGVYLRHEETEVVVVLKPFCTDSRLVSANSERGDYGWGGCYPEDEWENGTQ